jgi:hypothetical protein
MAFGRTARTGGHRQKGSCRIQPVRRTANTRRLTVSIVILTAGQEKSQGFVFFFTREIIGETNSHQSENSDFFLRFEQKWQNFHY